MESVKNNTCQLILYIHRISNELTFNRNCFTMSLGHLFSELFRIQQEFHKRIY